MGQKGAGIAATRRGTLAVAALLFLCRAGQPVDAASSETEGGNELVVATVEVPDLRERLTEREDKRRPAEPWSIEFADRPLTVSGEYEIGLGSVRRRVIGEDVEEPDRTLLEQELELEAFYSFGPALSLFAQLRAGSVEDQLTNTVDGVSERYLERGEMWLFSEDVGGTGANADLGRLHFEDDRQWWWDDDLDAIRVAVERGSVEVAVAAARELGPDRTDRDDVEPEHAEVLRLFAELSWDWVPGHGLELFFLHHDDRSADERLGQVVDNDGADETDAQLTWLGARGLGVVDTGTWGLLGYWLDAAMVRGRERSAGLEEVDARHSIVAEVRERDLRGWAADMGAIWILPVVLEPRVFVAYATGSGDRDPASGTDRSFRQSGLQSNESGFGGVERYASYGVLLDPELSNLRVSTLGAGLSLLRSSSLDLVYHQYRLVEPVFSLRDAALDLTLDATHRELGRELDLVLAVEEREQVELHVFASAFQAGRALGEQRDSWSYGGFVDLRIAF